MTEHQSIKMTCFVTPAIPEASYVTAVTSSIATFGDKKRNISSLAAGLFALALEYCILCVWIWQNANWHSGWNLILKLLFDQMEIPVLIALSQFDKHWFLFVPMKLHRPHLLWDFDVYESQMTNFGKQHWLVCLSALLCKQNGIPRVVCESNAGSFFLNFLSAKRSNILAAQFLI